MKLTINYVREGEALSNSMTTIASSLWRDREYTWCCEPFDELQYGSVNFADCGGLMMGWISVQPVDDEPEASSHSSKDWHQPEAQALLAHRLVAWLAQAHWLDLTKTAEAAIRRLEHEWYFPEGAEEIERWRSREDIDKAIMLAQELAQTWKGWASRGWTGDEFIEGLLASISELGEHGKERVQGTRDELRDNPERTPWEICWFREPIERFRSNGHMFFCWALQASAQVLWLDRVKARWEGITAPRAEITMLGSHTKLEKHIGAISWGFGAAGETQGGYTAAPQGVVHIINKASALGFVPRDKRPANTQLKLGLIDSTETYDGLQTMLNDTDAALGGGVAKALLWLSAAGCAEQRQITIGELTTHLNLGVTRLQKREHEATLADVRALRRLTLVLPDNSDIQILDIHAPREYESKDQAIVWRYMPSFNDLIRGRLSGGVGALNGQLLLNMDLAMRLTKRQTLELRALVYASAVFNDSKIGSRYSPDQAPWRTIEEIAATLNALSPAALEAMQGNSSSRSAKSKDNAKVLSALDCLDEMGGVRLETQGRGRHIKYRLVAPQSWQDAYQLWRSRWGS